MNCDDYDSDYQHEVIRQYEYELQNKNDPEIQRLNRQRYKLWKLKQDYEVEIRTCKKFANEHILKYGEQEFNWSTRFGEKVTEAYNLQRVKIEQGEDSSDSDSDLVLSSDSDSSDSDSSDSDSTDSDSSDSDDE